MVDFALEAQRSGGLTPGMCFIFRACLLRFRPIMMTTLAALFGALPLVLSGGDGSGITAAAGDTTIALRFGHEPAPTLYTTPVVYLFDRLRLLFACK